MRQWNINNFNKLNWKIKAKNKNIDSFKKNPTIPHMNEINTIHTKDLVIEFDSQKLYIGLVGLIL